MHNWGDENVDWRGIDDAAEYIGNFVNDMEELADNIKKNMEQCGFMHNSVILY